MLLIRSLLAIFLIATAAFAPVAGSRVQAASFEVVSDTQESHFPRELVFRMQAHSDQTITEVTLSFMVGRERVTAYGYPTFTPGRDIDAEYVLRTGADRYIPPMAKITYWYQLKDASGDKYESPHKTITYDDPKYRWQRTERGMLIVYTHERPQARAELVLNAGLETIAAAKANFGVDVTTPIALVVYNTRDEMNAALPPESAAVREALITLGQAHAEKDVVLVLDLRGNDGELIETTRHELQHVITHQATDNPYSPLPTWLNEGLSVFVQGGGERAYTTMVDQQQRRGNVLYLRDLAGRPGKPEENLLLYGVGYLVVKHLHDKYGPESLHKLLDAYKDGKSTDQAFTAAFGKPLDAIDSEWRATRGLPPVPERSAPALGASPVAVPTLVPFGANPAPVAPAATPAAAQPSAAPVPAQPAPAASQPASIPPVVLGAAGVVVVLLLLGGLAMRLRRR